MTPLPLQVAMEKALQDYQVAAQGLEGTSRESLGSATRIRATPRSRDTLVSLLEVQEPAPAVAPAFVTAESYAYEIPATVAGGFTTRRMDHLAVMAGLAGRNPQGLGIFLIAGGTADASAGELEPEFKRVLAWVGCRNEALGHIHPLHNERFNFDEESLLYGLELYRRIMLDK